MRCARLSPLRGSNWKRSHDPRARKVEQDLEDFNRLVEQLTTLARLEGAGLDQGKRSAGGMAEQVVGALAPLVYASGKEIEFVDRGPRHFGAIRRWSRTPCAISSKMPCAIRTPARTSASKPDPVRSFRSATTAIMSKLRKSLAGRGQDRPRAEDRRPHRGNPWRIFRLDEGSRPGGDSADHLCEAPLANLSCDPSVLLAPQPERDPASTVVTKDKDDANRGKRPIALARPQRQRSRRASCERRAITNCHNPTGARRSGSFWRCCASPCSPC